MAGELRAKFGGDIVRHTEAGDPVMDEGSGQVFVVESGSGMASGHLVKRSMIVKKYFMPSDSSRGPTKSMWRLPKRWSGGGCSVRGA